MKEIDHKIYNLKKGLSAYLSNRAQPVNEYDASAKQAAVEFLEQEVRKHHATSYTLHVIDADCGVVHCDFPSGVWACEVVKVVFYSPEPEQVVKLPYEIVDIPPELLNDQRTRDLLKDANADAHQLSLPSQTLNIVSHDFEDACEALRKNRFVYYAPLDQWHLAKEDSRIGPCEECSENDELTPWGHQAHGLVYICRECLRKYQRAQRKRANFPFLYGISGTDFAASAQQSVEAMRACGVSFGDASVGAFMTAEAVKEYLEKAATRTCPLCPDAKKKGD